MAISPRVIPANDPTRLSSDPGPIGPEVYVSSARVLEHQGNIEQAIANYKKAIEVSPDDRNAIIGYARLQHRQGNLPEATRAYHQIIAKNPQDAVALNDLGLCYARQGHFDQAISMLSTAIQVQPDSKLYRNNIATLLVEANRADEALTHLVQVHGAEVANYNIGYLLYQRGETDSAVPYLARAADADPTMVAASEMLRRLGALPAENGSSGRSIAATDAYPGDASEVGGQPRYPVGDYLTNRTEMAADDEWRHSGSRVGTAGETDNSSAPSPAHSPDFLRENRDRVGPFGYEPDVVAAQEFDDGRSLGRSDYASPLRMPPRRQALPPGEQPLTPPSPAFTADAGPYDRTPPRLLPPIGARY